MGNARRSDAEFTAAIAFGERERPGRGAILCRAAFVLSERFDHAGLLADETVATTRPLISFD
jgi:hypothetical protein